MNEFHLGVGQGWQFVGYHASLRSPPPGAALYTAEAIASLERSGVQVVMNPFGRVFTRKPGDGVFEPKPVMAGQEMAQS